ncbi:MAG: XTP/dITP diphosphatase [Deltaproteobacteria bacterium]|nr:XTP/dITP diphosphatase [Deltaproteobacteria bacterium]MBN2674352.1 XTP/dITP diphosphatase [Deltaproteobacteria bacterium]
MSRKLIVATGNRGKVKEINAIVAEMGFDVQSLLDLEGAPEIIEDRDTFEGNAAKKAQTVFDVFGVPTLADDSGLVVDALDGAPGVYSARYGGPGLSDIERYEKLLHELRDVPDEQRTARFECALAFVETGTPPRIFRGTIEGKISYSPSGDNGFGYDPVFIPIERQCTMAELSDENKKKISHRGRALRAFEKWLKQTVDQ